MESSQNISKNISSSSEEEYIYIPPRLELLSPSDFNKPTKGYNPFFVKNYLNDISEVYRFDFTVVLANPGIGKSRLLKELVISSSKNKMKAIYLDLKKIGKDELIEKLTDILKKKTLTLYSNKSFNNPIDYFHTEEITLNPPENDIIICLDALDEIQSDKTFETIEKIKKFKRSFPTIKIVLSCRNIIYKKYEAMFADLNVKIIKVEPFNSSDVQRYLSIYKFSDEEINQVISRFYSGFELRIINSPRILEIFVKLKNKEGLKNTLIKSKAELLDHFIYGELDIQAKTANTDLSIAKRVLEKVALTMEIYQTNVLTKDELLTFFDDIESNLGNNFLQQISIKEFYERSLLVLTEDKIQFHNREFQEYLAAKELTRLEKLEQSTFDIIVDKHLREIYPSWSNSLKYLLELHPEIQLPIIEFISRNENDHTFSLLTSFILDDPYKISTLSEITRKYTFNIIFSSYQKFKWYIGEYLSEKLSLYFTNELEPQLFANLDIKKDKDILIGNTLMIVGYLVETRQLPNLNLWKDRLVPILKDSSSSITLKKYSIRALSKFNELSILIDNFDYKNENSEIILSEFINACQKVSPSHEYTIDLTSYIIKRTDLNIYLRSDFEKIETYEGIKYYLSLLLSGAELFSRYTFKGFEDYKIDLQIKNIDKFFTTELENILTEIIFQHGANIDYNKFVSAIVDYLCKKDTNYILRVVDYIEEHKGGNTIFLWYRHIFERVLSVQNVDSFIHHVTNLKWEKDQIISLFWNFQYSSIVKVKDTFEATKKYFGSEYIRIEESNKQKNISFNIERDTDIYNNFKIRLEPLPGKYSKDIFRYYQNYKTSIDKLITDEDSNRMKDLLTNEVLKYDFSKANVTITDISETSKQYNLSDFIIIFQEAIPVFQDFGIKIEDYRKLLIEYLPFSFISSNSSDYIFKLLGELSATEINTFLSFYKTPEHNELFKSTLNNFYGACRFYNIQEAIPIIKEIIVDTSIEDHNRVEGLELINTIQPDFDFYDTIFKLFLKNTTDKCLEKLAGIANRNLIITANSYQEASIKWRMNWIIKNPISFTNPSNLDDINPHTIEFQMIDAFRNSGLLKVSDVKFKSLYLDLLSKAIILYKSKKAFRSYAVYIWNIVLAYFDNLKVLGSYSPIIELEKAIKKQSKFKGYPLLKSYFNKIKFNYLSVVGKPTTYSEAIKKYNKLKGTKYLPIISPEELNYLILDIIDTDIKRWIEKEGAYKFITNGTYHRKEDLIQKTIKTQFENALLRRGIRENEIKIRREEQLLDDKRTDFVISYGFIGQILIELKLTNNPDVIDPNYVDKLVQYIEGTKSDYGIYLIFQVHTAPKTSWKRLEPIVLKLYSNKKMIMIKGLNCTL